MQNVKRQVVSSIVSVGTGEDCVAGIPLTGTNGLIPDANILADVSASANCFSFVETIPGGFVPRFGGDLRDFGITAGVRGLIELGSGLTYDFSATHGQSRVDFFINNTVNASLGPNTPRNFIPGGQEQIETTLNADFGYLYDIGLASELSIAFGAEYRREQFDLFAGDQASFALGPLASQGFSSSSNGFGGFPNSSSNSQDSIDYKLAALYKLTDNVSLRGTVSTGFHAPTAGQANITNVTTQNVNGVLVDQGTLPLNTAAGQLAADFIASQNGGTRPALGTEEAFNLSAGVAFDVQGVSVTIDAFQNGTINRSEFAGLDQLSQFRFFTNSFDTRSRGVDIVARYPFSLAGGNSAIAVAANYTDTEVTDRGDINPISDGRVRALEDLLPNIKGNATFTHSQGIFRGLLRANYFGGWDDTGNGVDGISPEILIDAEVAAEVKEGIEIAVGANNLFDNYPDENPFAGSLGQLYPESAPTGFNGGQYYAKVRVNF